MERTRTLRHGQRQHLFHEDPGLRAVVLVDREQLAGMDVERQPGLVPRLDGEPHVLVRVRDVEQRALRVALRLLRLVAEDQRPPPMHRLLELRLHVL